MSLAVLQWSLLLALLMLGAAFCCAAFRFSSCRGNVSAKKKMTLSTTMPRNTRTGVAFDPRWQARRSRLVVVWCMARASYRRAGQKSTDPTRPHGPRRHAAARSVRTKPAKPVANARSRSANASSFSRPASSSNRPMPGRNTRSGKRCAFR